MLVLTSKKTTDGIVIPFMGRESLTHPGSAYLSLKTGAPMLPTFLIRNGRRFCIHFLAPIHPEGEADEDAIRAHTIAHSRGLERMIRRYPEQWFWFKNRWSRD